jgi:hypothetical protein
VPATTNWDSEPRAVPASIRICFRFANASAEITGTMVSFAVGSKEIMNNLSCPSFGKSRTRIRDAGAKTPLSGCRPDKGAPFYIAGIAYAPSRLLVGACLRVGWLGMRLAESRELPSGSSAQNRFRPPGFLL